ncbi:TetR family transcriptional regulator [Alloalcanivorax gelatiniphagus]
MSNPTRNVGRPAGRGRDTKADIVLAARTEFARNGFADTTLRAVAQRANVDTALLYHYFQNKRALFESAAAMPVAAREVVNEALSLARDERGESLARQYLQLWEDRVTGEQMRMLARTAISGTGAFERHSLAQLGLVPPGRVRVSPEPEARVNLALAHLFGVAVSRYLLQSAQTVEIDLDVLVRHVAPVLQRLLDGR